MDGGHPDSEIMRRAEGKSALRRGSPLIQRLAHSEIARWQQGANTASNLDGAGGPRARGHVSERTSLAEARPITSRGSGYAVAGRYLAAAFPEEGVARRMKMPNKLAAPDPAIASQLQIGCHWRGIGETEHSVQI